MKWTRDDFELPQAGLLRLTYLTTLRVPRFKDAVEYTFLQAKAKHSSQHKRRKPSTSTAAHRSTTTLPTPQHRGPHHKHRGHRKHLHVAGMG